MTDLATPAATQGAGRLKAFIDGLWDAEITPTLVDYIRIPNKSPAFDKDWAAHGHMDKAVELLEAWARRKITDLPGATLEVVRLEGRTPVILIEACEESGSPDLPYYVDHLGARLGQPSLVVCLDSGCGDYERMWLTTSLRGLMAGSLTVTVLDEGVHSGDASGVVASSFRILRHLLSRLEDPDTGMILSLDLFDEIPAQRAAQARQAAQVLGDAVYSKFPFAGAMTPVTPDLAELVLNRTWRPTLSLIGMDGIPAMGSAGNVLRPFTSAKLSIRLPPTKDAKSAAQSVKRLLEADPPYGAKVQFEIDSAETGWNAPALAPWLETAVAKASRQAFGAEAAYMGEGGSIPFMGMLGDKFPKAQFVITGVLGPHSNAHGPNEFLHLPTGKRVSQAVALILSDHFVRPHG